MSQRHWTWRSLIWMGMIILLLALSTLAPPRAYAGDPGVVPPDGTVDGMTYEQWTAAWWQWVLSIPAAENPLNQQGNVDCRAGQHGSVLFLGGTTEGEAERTCEVDAGSYLLFPLMNLVAWSPGDFETEEEGREILDYYMAYATGLHAEVNAVTIDNIEAYRSGSPLFQFTTPDAEPLFYYGGQGLQPNSTYDGLSDGYWVMLEPLPAGEYTLHFRGGMNYPDWTWETHVTYHITVVEPTSITLGDFESDAGSMSPYWVGLGLLLVPALAWRRRMKRRHYRLL
jgi:hypothetical protein